MKTYRRFVVTMDEVPKPHIQFSPEYKLLVVDGLLKVEALLKEMVFMDNMLDRENLRKEVKEILDEIEKEVLGD